MRELLQSLRGRPAPVLPNIDSTGEASRMLDAILRAAANEGASDAAQFAQRYISTGNEVLFDNGCLADTAGRLATAK